MTEAAPTSPVPASDERERSHHRELLIVFSGLMLGMLLAALDQTIVSTALPTIVGDLGGLAHLSWVVTAYILASTVSTPIYGKLGDLYGRKRIFQAAIVIFLAGSALSGLSQNLDMLIAFRAVQGLGAGGLMVGAMAIIGDLVSPRERGRYQGYFGGMFGFASIAGPLLGGFFTDHLSWRWVFYINIPLGAAALVVVATKLHLPRRTTKHRIDYEGTALLAAGVTCLVLLTTWGGNDYPWTSPTIISLGVAGVVLLAAFIAVERRVPEPVLPLHLFRSSIFNVTSGVGFILGFAMFGAIVFLPLFLQIINGQSATSSGLLLLPMMAGVLSTSIGSGVVISRWGRYKVFPVAGTLLMTVGMFLFSTMTPATPSLVSSLYMVILGAGLGLVMQVLVLVVQNAADPKDLGVATSAATFFRAIGGSFGVSIFGAIFSNQLTAELAKRFSPQALARFGLNNGAHLQPAQVHALPDAIRLPFIDAFAASLHVTFLAAVPCAALAFVVALWLKEIPLRRHAAATGPQRSASPALTDSEVIAESIPQAESGITAESAPDVDPDALGEAEAGVPG